MAINFKQRCNSCKKNYVITNNRQRFVQCYDCQRQYLKGDIKDQKMKELFNIPEDYYRENSFLRDIKIKYLRYPSLTEKQIEAFKKTVDKMRQEKARSSNINKLDDY